jgi:hypothetical protein
VVQGRRYGRAVSSGQPLVVEPWVGDALVAALRDAGCPSGMAERLSSEARVVGPKGTPDCMLMLLNHGTSYPADEDEADYAAGHLARNLAADNAEAVDRTARGESGWTSYWPLPNRSPRRR